MNIELFLDRLYQQKRRKTGEPAVNHLYAVRQLLVEQGVDDDEVLTAALLHDVLEDTDLSRDYLSLRFGDRVAHIVNLLSKKEMWNTSYCRMKSAMDEMEAEWTEYPEAIVIKMADRLHNLMTIHGFDAEKQKEYLAETEETLMPVFELILEKVPLERYRIPVSNLYEQLDRLNRTLRHQLTHSPHGC